MRSASLHRSLPSLLVAVLALFPTASVWGQAGGTLTSGIATYTHTTAPSSETSTSPTGDFRPEGGTTTDHLFQNWWYYRVSGDTRERPFGIYTKSDGGALTGTSSFVGNTATYDWTETNSLGGTRFTAQYVVTLTDGPVAGSASATHAMTITNPSATDPLVISLFHYADFDVGGTAGSDVAVGGLLGMTISEGLNSVVFAPTTSANAFQVTTFATLRGLLLNAAVDNLNNTGLPFGPGDFTGGYQWDITVPASSSLTINSLFDINPVGVPEPATIILVSAMAGVGGLAINRRIRSLRRRRKPVTLANLVLAR